MQIKLLIILLFPFAFLAQPNLTIDKKYYKITYSQKLKQPLTVDYGIRTRECTATRSGMEFYAEKGVITSSNVDYANNEWDKGHMAPAADFCFSRDAMLSTFSYANSALQHYKLNRGVWKELEAAERVWAEKDSITAKLPKGEKREIIPSFAGVTMRIHKPKKPGDGGRGG